ncbi:MAG: metal ABC transporter solute-binding protein, Zn/Mn family [Cyanobium sp.]
MATTVWPVTLFTKAVAGDCAQVTPLIPAGADAHALQARPGDLLALGRARALVLNGLGLESGLQRLIQAADNPHLVLIDSSRGIRTLRVSSSSEPSDHGHNQADGHDQADGDEHAHGHADAAGAINPHIWLDPLRAVQQVQTIRDGLVQLDPACAAGYRRRAEAYITRLRALHQDLAASLAPVRGRTFVAFHDVAPYFGQRYGLAAAFLVEA